MGSMVNALEIPETPDRRQSIFDLENQPYTKFPNVWLDEIRYRLNKTVCDIVECALRQTMGFHRDTAQITTQEFADYARVSLSKAHEAKKDAMALGILVLIKRGGGLETSEYGINLDYDPDFLGIWEDDSEKPKRIPESIQQEITDDPVHEEAEIIYPFDSKPQQPQDPEIPKNPEPKEPKKAKKQAKSRDSETKRSYRGSKKDPEVNKKTNRNDDDSEKTEVSEERKKLGDVCSLLRNLGFKISNRDFGFLKKLATQFGIGKLLEKIKILRSQLARNIKIHTLCGWLRSALKRDFQPYEADKKKIEADAARERVYERKCLESQQRAAEDQELIEARKSDPEIDNRVNAICDAFLHPQLES